jgi:hypothetical protein
MGNKIQNNRNMDNKILNRTNAKGEKLYVDVCKPECNIVGKWCGSCTGCTLDHVERKIK